MRGTEAVEVITNDNRLVGRAHFSRHRGRISTTFIYDSGYIASGGENIDPSLVLDPAPQYREGLVGAFSDSAPDRWGRNIIEKAERLRARDSNRSPRRLGELDFLLGVSDNTRQGALRYRLAGQSGFLGEDSRVPRLISLPALLRASDEVSSKDDPDAAIKELLDTGTTGLGGARPKASVMLEDGGLAIAKFPHASDRWDVMAWEATMLDLLADAGMRVAEHRLMKVGRRSVLVVRRFDREKDGKRRGYISAMTAVASQDGVQRDYADIAEAIRDTAFSPKREHRTLYHRVIGSVALGNTDDHLRNHGFLMREGAWEMSPIFDVNPHPDLHKRRSTSIMGADTFPDEVEGLLALASECGVSLEDARARAHKICRALSRWRERARENGITEREISHMGQSIQPRLEAVAAM